MPQSNLLRTTKMPRNHLHIWSLSDTQCELLTIVPSTYKNVSLLYSFQTGSGAHPASSPMSTGAQFSGGKAVGAWCWSQTNIPVPKLRIVELYLCFLLHLHGIVLN
jgi:hypothetical protein